MFQSILHRSWARGVLLGLTYFLWAAPPVLAGSANVSGVIAKNVDGDTVWVQPEQHTWLNFAPFAAAKPLKIRMIGIDAPESHLPTSHGVVGQGKWGQLAADALEEMVPLGTPVGVEDEGLDKYGRTLGRVFRRNEDINLKMVKDGWAIPYIICEGARCNEGFFDAENVPDYLAACAEAKSQGVGVFDADEPLKEMPFEFRLRMQNRPPDKWVGNFETKELVRPENYARVPVCSRIFFMTKKSAVALGFELRS